MTLEEAKQKAREGHKVTHLLFTSNEYMYYGNGWKGLGYYFEDKVRIPEWWWHEECRQDGWGLFKES